MPENKNILYAEDRPETQEITLEFFETFFPSHIVEVFSDGASLDKRLECGSLDTIGVVVTDNEMPEMNGTDIIRKYAQRESYVGIPFVLYYGGVPAIGEQALQHGAIKIFHKPCNIRSLMEYVQEVMKL